MKNKSLSDHYSKDFISKMPICYHKVKCLEKSDISEFKTAKSKTLKTDHMVCKKPTKHTIRFTDYEFLRGI